MRKARVRDSTDDSFPCPKSPRHMTRAVAAYWPRHDAGRTNHHQGFSLLEMMTVVAIIMIVAAIASPIYITSRIRAEEAVLHDHLFTLRFLIDRFTLDHGRAPAWWIPVFTGMT